MPHDEPMPNCLDLLRSWAETDAIAAAAESEFVNAVIAALTGLGQAPTLEMFLRATSLRLKATEAMARVASFDSDSQGELQQQLVTSDRETSRQES